MKFLHNGCPTIRLISIIFLSLHIWCPLLWSANLDLTVTSISPQLVVKTESVQFRLILQNLGDTVTLDPNTSIRFSDGTTIYTSGLLNEITLDSGNSSQLIFALQSIPDAFSPGSFNPILTLCGTAGAEGFSYEITLSEFPVEVKPNISQLSELPGNWPRTAPRGFGCPYLIWLFNNSGVNIELDQRSRIAVTDGMNLYAHGNLALQQSLPAGVRTKLEFTPGDFWNIPLGEYYAIVTLIGPNYSQTLELKNNRINVIEYYFSIGIAPSIVTKVLDTSGGIINYTAVTGGNNDILFEYSTPLDAPGPGPDFCPTFCDIDEDGDLDFFAGGGWGNITFYENTGTRTVPSWGTFLPGYESMRVGGRSKPAFVDIDGDGDYDLFVGDAIGTIWFYRNLGTAANPDWTKSPRKYPTVSIGAEVSPTFADIDEDVDYDLFIGTADGTVWFFQNTGTSSLPAWADGVQLPSLDVGDNSVPVLADIDADGDKDLFIGSEDGTITFVENIGTATAAQWAEPISNYGGINVGAKAAPALADIDGDLDFDLFIGRSSSEGVVFYHNIGTSTTPVWSNEPFSPTYIKPADYPSMFQFVPIESSLVTVPTEFYLEGRSQVTFPVIVLPSADVLFGVQYSNIVNIKFCLPCLDPGIGLGGSVSALNEITFDDDCEAIISSITCSSSQVVRSEEINIEVHVNNPKPYPLKLELSPSKTTLKFQQHQKDVSKKFTVILKSSPNNIPEQGEAVLLFGVTPNRDAPSGEITIEPVVTTSTETLTSSTFGSAEWPVPSTVNITVLPYFPIVTDLSSVTVPENGTATFGVKLADQPSAEVVVTVTNAGGDTDISILENSVITFNPQKWDTYQMVVLQAAADPDRENGKAIISCAAPGYVSQDVEAVEFDRFFCYVNDETEENGFAPGNDDNNGLSPATPKRNIQSILGAYARTGLCIYVSAGNYVEYIVIDPNYQGLELIGAGEDITAIDSCQMTIDGCPDVSITGFTIKNADRGIYCNNCSPTIHHCIIRDNRNGGVYVKDGSPTINHCHIYGNTGTGIRINNGSPTIEYCHIEGNWPGLIIRTGNPVISNCMINDNRGGGVKFIYANALIINCTICTNYGADLGGGIYCGSSRVTLKNSVLWNNIASHGSQIALQYDSRASISYCDIEAGLENVWISDFVDWGEGNIDADPCFVDSDGPDDNPATWQDNNNHITVSSPCLNAGDPNFQPAPAETDIDGEPRIAHQRVDMGADEYRPYDINLDGSINLSDFALLGNHWFEDCYPLTWCEDCDVNQDGRVDIGDLMKLVTCWLEGL